MLLCSALGASAKVTDPVSFGQAAATENHISLDLELNLQN